MKVRPGRLGPWICGRGRPWTMHRMVAANLLTNHFTQKEDRARTQGTRGHLILLQNSGPK
jgi:hypothetical protein